MGSWIKRIKSGVKTLTQNLSKGTVRHTISGSPQGNAPRITRSVTSESSSAGNMRTTTTVSRGDGTTKRTVRSGGSKTVTLKPMKAPKPKAVSNPFKSSFSVKVSRPKKAFGGRKTRSKSPW